MFWKKKKIYGMVLAVLAAEKIRTDEDEECRRRKTG